MSDIEFPKGLMVKAPRTGAPDFVKMSISIKVAELQEWLSTKQTEWVNLDVKESKEGKLYAAVNNWKPDGSKAGPAKAATTKPAAKPERDEFVDDEIPF